MTGILHRADELLHGERKTPSPGRTPVTLVQLLALIAIFGVLYGAVMGLFGGVRGDRLLQPLYSGLKVPLLLLVTFALSLPSFFVLNTLMGVRNDFNEAMKALMATQAVLTIVLAALAPFTAVWYASSANYQAAILFNALMFAIASFTAQKLLRRWYGPLIARDSRHRLLLRSWIIIYAFVGIQMGWMLRPFVGDPRSPTRFFRQDPFGNAYVQVANIVIRAFGN